MKRRSFIKIGTGTLVASTLAACGGGEDGGRLPGDTVATAQHKVVVGWNQQALQAVRKVKPGPPMVARSLAVLHTCMYNAWAAYDTVAAATPQVPQMRRPAAERTAENRAKAMSHAAYAALVDQFPTEKNSFDAYLSSLGHGDTSAGQDPPTPAGTGRLLAAALLAFYHQDGSNQLGDRTPGGKPYADYSGYVPKNPAMAVGRPTALDEIPAPGSWQPLSYADASGAVVTPVFVGACWDRVAPFALASASQFRPGPPFAFGTPEYAAQTQRIVDVQASLTERQKVIAEYWADGPDTELPPGHWCLFGQYVSERDGHRDDEDVKMFFALANAVFDAGIACWDAKRAYDSPRPITAVRYLMHGKTISGYGPEGPAAGVRPIAGEAWMPYQRSIFPTPPFPEHVSGHSSFSAAAAEVLKLFTGSDAFGASYTRGARSMAIEPNLPSADLTLRWATFSDAADEAGLSRIYGGIHFDNANLAGQELGRKVAAQAFEKARKYWLGQG